MIYIAVSYVNDCFTGTLSEIYASIIQNGDSLDDYTFYEAEEILFEVKVIKKQTLKVKE